MKHAITKLNLVPATAPMDGGGISPVIYCREEDVEKVRNLVQDIREKAGYHIQMFDLGKVAVLGEHQ